MYTLILMSALTSAPDSADFGGCFRNLFHRNDHETATNGCHGSSASASSGCYGTSCQGSSCHGTSCNGHSCNGSNNTSSGFGHRMRGLFHRDKDSHSCYGSGSQKSSGCYGSAAHAGCSGGSGYGCSGSVYAHSCMGGCMGSAMSPVWSGPMYSDGFGGMPGNDCCGGAPSGGASPFPGGIYGGDAVSPPPMMAPSPPLPTNPTIPPAFDSNPATPRPAPPPTVEESRSTPASRFAAANGNRATVVVRLPADAKLYAEGRRLNLTSAERTFVTPVLPNGEQFSYVFRAEYDRNGETISLTKRVAIAAGRTVNVEFNDLDAITRTAPATAPAVIPTEATTASPQRLPTIPPAIAGPTATLATQSKSSVSRSATTERARIAVRIPSGAKLFVDNRESNTVGERGDFTTPPLPVGEEFTYTMRVERTRNGQPESQTQKVMFRAGESVTVDFTDWPTR